MDSLDEGYSPVDKMTRDKVQNSVICRLLKHVTEFNIKTVILTMSCSLVICTVFSEENTTFSL